MNFHEMDPDLVRRLLDEKDENGTPLHQDILTPEATKEQAFLRTAVCPSCRTGSLESFVDPRAPFSPRLPLARRQLRCLSCRTEFDPHSGLITKAMSSPA